MRNGGPSPQLRRQLCRSEQLEPRQLLAADSYPVLNPAASPSLEPSWQLTAAPQAGRIVGSTPVSSLVAASGPAANVLDNGRDPAGIAVIGVDATAGTAYYTTDGGASWHEVGEVSAASALLLAADPATRLAFVPTADGTVEVVDAITFKAWSSTVDLPNGSRGVNTLTPHSQLVSRIASGDAALAAAIAPGGTLGLVADRAAGLQVIDITTPTASRVVGVVDTPGAAVDVAVQGTQAFVADDYEGLAIIDFSTPARPQLVASIETSGYALGVASAGPRYVFVAAGLGGLDIVDLEAAGGPGKVKTVPLVDHALAVTASADGRYAYVSLANGQLRIIDALTPATAAVIRTVALNTPTVEGIAVSNDGSLAYVACGRSGLRVVNIATGAVVGSLDTDGYAWDAALATTDGVLYVADGRDCGTLVIDVSSPSQPRKAGRLDASVAAQGIAVSTTTGTLLVSDFGGGTLVLDPTRPNSTGVTRTIGVAKRLAVRPDGAYAFIADNLTGLTIIETGATGTERVTGTVATGRFAVDVALSASGRYAYVADTTTGLVVVDAANPANPINTRVLQSPLNPTAIATSPDGSHAYVADKFGGIVIYNLANPAIPQKVKAVGGHWPASDLAVSTNGQLVAVAAATNGIQLFDVANPTTAASLATIGLGGLSASGVAISPDSATAYAVTESGSLHAIDLANPSAPAQLAELELGLPANGISVDHDGLRAYVATSGGVITIDVSQRDRPLLLGTIATPGQPQGTLVTANGRLFIAANGGGLVVQQLGSPFGFSVASDTVSARLRGVVESRGSLSLTRAASGVWQAGVQTISAGDSLPAVEATWQFMEAESVAGSNTVFARHASGALHRLVASETWQLLGFAGIGNAVNRSLPPAARGEANPGGSQPVLPAGLTLPLELGGLTQLRVNGAGELFANDTPLTRDDSPLTRADLPGRAIAVESLPAGNQLLLQGPTGGLLVWRFDIAWQFLSADAEVAVETGPGRQLELQFGQLL